jgi:hypothetical protein
MAMIEILKTVFLSLSVIDWALLYMLSGLVTLLALIQTWRGIDGIDDGMEDNMTKMFFLSVIAWPYVVILFVFSWPVFSWAFWLRPITLKSIRFTTPWRVK